MPDLLLIIPSRARPRNIARLIDSMKETCRLGTHFVLGVDDDDPELAAYEFVMEHAGGFGSMITGPRKGLTAWTNSLASVYAGDYPYLGSFGDDHLPVTPGWDKALVKAVQKMGTGFAYPWDNSREDIPEAVVMSSGIVRALGWMALPSLEHWYIDIVWADLGHGAGCIKHLRAVVVDHVHPGKGKAPADQTYADSGGKITADRDAYHQWRRSGQMTEDINKILSLQSL
jgi:hypothetical protein